MNKIKNGLTITNKRFQEVADHINDSFGSLFTKEQIIKADLSRSLLLEIADNTYTDTCQREQIAEELAIKYIGMRWPCYGDSDEINEKFQKLATRKGILK